jgi:hypothetical protein
VSLLAEVALTLLLGGPIIAATILRYVVERGWVR